MLMRRMPKALSGGEELQHLRFRFWTPVALRLRGVDSSSVYTFAAMHLECSFVEIVLIQLHVDICRD